MAYIWVIATDIFVGASLMTALNYIACTVVLMILVMFSVLISAPVSTAGL